MYSTFKSLTLTLAAPACLVGAFFAVGALVACSAGGDASTASENQTALSPTAPTSSPAPTSPTARPDAGTVRPPADSGVAVECTGPESCATAFHCSTEDGVCNSTPSDGGLAGPAVCSGTCVPDLECTSSIQCDPDRTGKHCSTDDGVCNSAAPLAVCLGTCVLAR
jgi:hypothetical protein